MTTSTKISLEAARNAENDAYLELVVKLRTAYEELQI